MTASLQLIRAQLYEYLLSDPIEMNEAFYGQYCPPGNDSPVIYDVSDEYPQSPADFTCNQGRLVIGGGSASFGDCDNLARASLTLSAFAVCSPDAAFLAEHALRLLKHWNRQDLPSIGGQCVQSLHGFNYTGPRYQQSENLYRASVTFTAIAR